MLFGMIWLLRSSSKADCEEKAPAVVPTVLFIFSHDVEGHGFLHR